MLMWVWEAQGRFLRGKDTKSGASNESNVPAKRSGNSREKRCQLQKHGRVEASEKLNDLAKAFRHQSWY